jgi:RNA polymerase sigma-70 factor (ECF subfamily)
MVSAVLPGAASDEEQRLIAEARQGDVRAFSRLVYAHQGRVRAYLGGFIRRADVVDDLAQEVFLNAFRSLDSYKGESPFGIWLLGIARNKALMFVRDEVRRATRESSSVDAVLAPHRAEALEASGADLRRREREILALQSCLESLPPGSADMIAERYFKARSVAEIAQGLGKREGTVRMSLLRVRQALRACVEQRLARGEAA